MCRDHDTLLLNQACRVRWPGRHIAELARLTGRSKGAAASWLSGRRRMPAAAMNALAKSLRDAGNELRGLADALARAASQASMQPRRPRGFQIIKDWGGNGVARDARWRGGRRSRS
jgi:hypothetical protein